MSLQDKLDTQITAGSVCLWQYRAWWDAFTDTCLTDYHWSARVRGEAPDNDAHKPLVMCDLSDIGLSDYYKYISGILTLPFILRLPILLAITWSPLSSFPRNHCGLSDILTNKVFHYFKASSGGCRDKNGQLFQREKFKWMKVLLAKHNILYFNFNCITLNESLVHSQPLNTHT